MADEPTVPGEFRCPECGFVVIKSVMNPSTGAVGRDAADRMEPCPNDGSILRQVIYCEALVEAREEACRFGARARIGEQMETLLHNLLVRGRLAGHEKMAAGERHQRLAAVRGRGAAAAVGSAWKIILQPGQEFTFRGYDATPDIASNAKNIDLAGTGAQVLQVAIVVG